MHTTIRFHGDFPSDIAAEALRRAEWLVTEAVMRQWTSILIQVLPSMEICREYPHAHLGNNVVVGFRAMNKEGIPVIGAVATSSIGYIVEIPYTEHSKAVTMVEEPFFVKEGRA